VTVSDRQLGHAEGTPATDPEVLRRAASGVPMSGPTSGRTRCLLDAAALAAIDADDESGG
jgi:hypothetical protein